MSDQNKEIMVSICCLAYNHAKYLKQCLDGFIMQKTSFRYEVIVHDDASTDRTTEIVREYISEYPGLIRGILQVENQHSKGKTLPQVYREFLYPMVRGKYIAYCEGDDFWTDPNKLQKQVDALEENCECSICFHKVRTTDETGVPAEITYPSIRLATGVILADRFLWGLTDGAFPHTTSFLCRAELIKRILDDVPEFWKVSYVDDVPLLLYFGQIGNVYYIDSEMSCYRRNSLGSWTEGQSGNKEKILSFKWKMIEMYRKFDDYTNHRFYAQVNHWIDNERFMIAEYEHDYKEMKKKKYRIFMKGRSLAFKLRVLILGNIPF